MQINNINSQQNFKGKTFLMIKPHILKENKVPEVLEYIFQNTKGLKITKLKRDILTKEQAEYHYAEHKNKSNFKEIVNAILEGPIIKLEIKGPKAVKQTQKIKKALRMLFRDSETRLRNVIHMADSKKSAKRELAFHLPPSTQSFSKNLISYFKK